MAQDNEVKQIVFANVREMPPLAVSLADTRYNKTGSWRRLRPVYGERGSPCDAGCPNGNGVRSMLGLVADGRLEEALSTLRETSALPGVCGRVCYHPCESECNRGRFDEPLAVQAVERFLADSGKLSDPPHAPPSGRRVAVIGSGPAGLSCSYHLARQGHGVVLYEAQPQLGGLLRYGIPAYRLPRPVLDREIDALLAAGEVEVRAGQRFGHDFGAEELAPFDAVFMALGAQRSRRLSLPGEELPGVMPGLRLLHMVAEGWRPSLGRRVVVIGGGNTAVDSARVARRLGAEVTIVYRRSRGEMPAITEEVLAAEEEGVSWRYQAAPVRFVVTDGNVVAVAFVPTRPGAVDSDGRARPEEAGPAFELPADTVVVAIGEESDQSLLPAGAVPVGQPVGKNGGGEGQVWLTGGDFAGGRRRVVDAMADGRRAALAIDRRLRGGAEAVMAPEATVRYEELNKDYFWPQPREAVPEVAAAERVLDFQEVVGELDAVEVAREAARCFSCGACTQCDNCWLFCPDIAVQRATTGYSIDYAYCKGCGICAKECPRSAISMREEVG